MEVSVLIGQKAVHGSFGTGIIESADDKHIVVSFPETGKQAKFKYPDAFASFLKADASYAEMVETDLQARNAAVAEANRVRHELQEKKDEELREQQRAIRERRQKAQEDKERREQRAKEKLLESRRKAAEAAETSEEN